MSKPPSANPIRRFFKRRIFTLRPGRFVFFRRFPAPKTLLLKETFSQLQFIIGTGVSVTKQIRHMQYGKSPLTTDVLRLQRIRTKAALSNHRISLKTSRRFSPRCSPTRRHFQNRPLTKNRQPKHIFNGSRDTSLFRCSPTRRHFQNRPLTKNRQPEHIFNGSRRHFSLPLRIRPLARQTNTHQDKRSTPSVSFHEKSDKENPSLPGGGFRPLHGRKPSSSSL